MFKTPRILSWIYPRRTWGFSRNEPVVYLTFDDGPTHELSTWILQVLAEHEVHATFFCVGENIQKYPSVFSEIREKGHSVANHTMHHEKSPKTSWKIYRNSVESCAELVENTLFRPPYGRLNMWKSLLLSRRLRIIMWSWLSYDYDLNVPVSCILESAERDIKAGDILVLHDNKKVESRLKLILPALIEIIKAKQLKFAVIPDLGHNV